MFGKTSFLNHAYLQANSARTKRQVLEFCIVWTELLPTAAIRHRCHKLKSENDKPVFKPDLKLAETVLRAVNSS